MRFSPQLIMGFIDPYPIHPSALLFELESSSY
jgi:hypothetical protein